MKPNIDKYIRETTTHYTLSSSPIWANMLQITNIGVCPAYYGWLSLAYPLLFEGKVCVWRQGIRRKEKGIKNKE